MAREIDEGAHGVGTAVAASPRGYGASRGCGVVVSAGAGALAAEGEGGAAEERGGRWFVIRTRSRQEKALSLDLGARGIEHFLPLSRVVRYYGKRKAVVMEPLFPGYLFLRGEVEEAYAAERTGRVAQVLAAPDQDRLGEELSQVRRALVRGAVLMAREGLGRGARVEVVSGPFRGIRGTVESAVKEDRLILNVELIAKSAQLEIDGTLLRAIE